MILLSAAKAFAAGVRLAIGAVWNPTPVSLGDAIAALVWLPVLGLFVFGIIALVIACYAAAAVLLVPAALLFVWAGRPAS